ncbi:MAG: Na+/H+ antiporter NhaA [Novosphingobium sp.]|nr:Na+/H+ antiporter NhaA [Novosphingobium sp.]
MIARRSRNFANRLSARLLRGLHGDAGAGGLLIAVALAAMLAANSPLAGAYHAAFHAPLAWTPVAALGTFHAWINDGLMAVFFFVVGLEIKREMLEGDLSTPARRRLPVLAAAAGMAMPALVYLAIAGTRAPLIRGWAIPAATDIAFAVGVLGLLGRDRVPPALRLFLLTVAIVDDLGAVAIIAIAYTATLALAWLAAAAGVLAGMIVLNRLRIGNGVAYALAALALWLCVLHSGIHPTIAGVLAAFCMPLALDRHGDSPLLRFEHALAPWSGYLIVPLFGFANAGVSLAGIGLGGFAAALPLAVAAGLVAGKQIGIYSALILAQRFGFAAPPHGATRLQLWGTAVLCGIGFTMSLFITELAFPTHPELVAQAKLGILAGSLISAVLGYAILRVAAARR